MWTLCIRVPKDKVTVDGRRLICFTVPQLVTPLVNRPDPPPFFKHDKVDEKDVFSIQALATIDAIAERMSGELATDIRRSVAGHLQAFGRKLGEGIELSHHEGRAA